MNSAGENLRDLTARAERGEFSLGPMLMALCEAPRQLRANRHSNCDGKRSCWELPTNCKRRKQGVI
ncbi:hypothetical protein B5K06_33665 [Rhizobium grahamii]|uniref:Uncharacterized protein n=1 Tax=Rhizobium grahamii TaxID=1120045 RepID=A0A370KDR9_9HYPH|nr:hypothetical protein B5K06_33665 [Rhizobium grahamii]